MKEVIVKGWDKRVIFYNSFMVDDPFLISFHSSDID